MADGMIDISITKRADDPTGISRISLGGGPKIGGYYCVYRGSKEEAIQCLAKCLLAMREMARQLGDREPDIREDDEKEVVQ